MCVNTVLVAVADSSEVHATPACMHACSPTGTCQICRLPCGMDQTSACVRADHTPIFVLLSNTLLPCSDLTSDNLLCEVCPWAWEVMQHISGMSIPELQQLYQPHQLPLVLLQPMLTDGLPSEGPLQSRSQRATGKATYSAPEVPSACQQSDKVDSWSLGCMALGLM